LQFAGNRLAAQPLGASTSAITVLSPTDTEGTINITIVNSVLNATDPEHGSFAAFSKCAVFEWCDR
jgi:hypothetical protein